MASLKYIKAEPIQLKGHPVFNETWLRDRILEDPTILGLGEVEVKDKERRQPRAGRLDLLLRDPETDSRYEVELMLGVVDESHIIRCIEYWDIERKRYPQYDHYAVLIAENITSRFLNVIGLFNTAMPIIAIQLNAFKVGDSITLNFVKVLDIVVPGEDEEDEEGPTTDRRYWEQRVPRWSLETVDGCIKLLQELDSAIEHNYRKFFIGLLSQGRPNNFVIFHPKKGFVRVGVRTRDLWTWTGRLEQSGLTPMATGKRGGRVRFRLTRADMEAHASLLRELFAASYQELRQ